MEEGRYRGPAYETARLKLARIRVEGKASRERGARYLVQVSADSLGIGRAGFWLLRDGDRRLESECVYRRADATYETGHRLELKETARLWSLLGERRLFSLETPQHLELLGTFSSYLRSVAATAVLCAPIIREGRVVGMLSFERTDESEPFGERQLSFASSVADLAALILEQSERVELEAALQASAESRAEVQKMQALVRLSRSVAHDLNGLLTIVSAAAQELSLDAGAHQELGGELDHVVRLGKTLTEQLLTFGGEPLPGEPVELRSLVEQLLPVVRPLFSGEKKLTFEATTTKTTVLAGVLPVQQVILNLVKNAAEALGPKGTVVVKLRDPEPDDALRVGAVVVEVSDDGMGMDEYTQARAVEPYFTTKKGGHGLGLSAVFGVAQRFGGGVRITSAIGQGTRIAVALLRA